MSIFKRKRRAMGKGADDTVTLHKKFEVLNCTPVDYKYTIQYANFMNSAETKFGKVIDKISIDDLCDTMFDAYIDSVIIQMKEAAKEQYTYHMQVIDNHKGILEGELVLANRHLENLRQDLKEIENEIGTYKQMKKEKNIF